MDSENFANGNCNARRGALGRNIESYHGVLSIVGQFSTCRPLYSNRSQPQRVADHAYRRERHCRSGDDWRKKQTECRIENPSCDRYPGGVVHERKEEVLADVAHGGLGKAHKQLSVLRAALQAPHDRITIKPVAHSRGPRNIQSGNVGPT